VLNAVIGALFIGLSLGLFGSGGSILTVPVLLYLVNMEPNVAIASSLLVVAGISLFGTIPHIRKRFISWPHVLLFGVPGMMGTYGGAWAGALVDPRWQLGFFVVLMLVASVFMWKKSDPLAAPATSVPETLKIGRVALDGLVVGAITGFVGVGGGFLIVPALVLLGGLAMPLAIGTSLAIIALKSIVGFAKYYSVLTAADYTFDWLVIGLMIAGGFLGSWFGSWVGGKLPKHQLQRGFAVFLVIMGVFVFVRSVL